jgi:urease accessory protein
VKETTTTARRVGTIVAGGVSAVLLWPAAAEAHLVTTGLGPVYDGISHVLMSPDDLVPAVAMALLAGLNGSTAARRTLFVITGAWLVGGVAGFLSGHPLVPGSVTTASFLVLGALTAADVRLPPGLVTALALVFGLAGIAGAVFVIVALASAFVVSRRAAWMRVAIRVAGSWVAAIGLLMLGWSLRGTM